MHRQKKTDIFVKLIPSFVSKETCLACIFRLLDCSIIHLINNKIYITTKILIKKKEISLKNDRVII